ncbi:MAG TPA: hypothetical protein VFE53_13705 [Mucilaginibacter sp.]|jgi:hypothetical protein|nr:hypothetical protein [Mucilaginibacter sp.]
MKPVFVFLLLLIFFTCRAQQKPVVRDYSVIKTSAWVIPRTDTLDYSFGDYQGKKALFMTRKFGNYKSASIAYPPRLNFKDGVIEADLAWPGKQGGYIGLAFRIKDTHHYQVVYFRPESSGTINAIQYMPETKAEFNWWDYEADKYQAKATLPLHDWFHVKLVVKGNSVSVYVNNQAKPAMVYNAMDSSLQSGVVGYWLGNSEKGAFKNLMVNGY